jgi:tRNA(fMet)-specific endonuclease VapC
MSQYLLDTDICIELFHHNPMVIDKIDAEGRENCFVSEITIAELFYGAAKSGRKENFNDINTLQRLFEIIPLFPSLKLYGANKAILQSNGLAVGEFDLLIGSCAVHNGLTMVTSNCLYSQHYIGRLGK